jgi:hypothetical protein
MKPENDPAYETRLRDKINELMQKGGGYYPFERSNFKEFLDHMTDEQKHKLANDICYGYYLTAGCELQLHAENFWKRLARIEAEARLAEEYDSCKRCGGTGCSDCEDKEHDYD